VRPVHSKAMPVVLTEPAEWDAWLEADAVGPIGVDAISNVGLSAGEPSVYDAAVKMRPGAHLPSIQVE
jgi:hypothetical protein